MGIEDPFERAGGGTVAAGNGDTSTVGMLQGAAYHLVRNGVGKQHQQVGAADLLFKIGRHLGKYLCLAAVLLADLFVLAHHAVVAAYNDNAHGIGSFVSF